MKPLEIKILEIELRRAQALVNRLEGISVQVPNELEESLAFSHTPVNSGPEYLTVYCSSWSLDHVTEFGTFQNLAEARKVAEKHGLKGISVVFRSKE